MNFSHASNELINCSLLVIRDEQDNNIYDNVRVSNLLYWTLDDSNSPARRMCGLHLGDKPSAMPIPIIKTTPNPKPRPTPRPMFMSVEGAGTPIEGACVGE